MLLCGESLLGVGGVGWKNEWALSQEAGNPPCRTLDASEQFLLSLSRGLGSPGAGGSWSGAGFSCGGGAPPWE